MFLTLSRRPIVFFNLAIITNIIIYNAAKAALQQ